VKLEEKFYCVFGEEIEFGARKCPQNQVCKKYNSNISNLLQYLYHYYVKPEKGDTIMVPSSMPGDHTPLSAQVAPIAVAPPANPVAQHLQTTPEDRMFSLKDLAQATETAIKGLNSVKTRLRVCEDIQ
jgi:hypothetical protein